MGTHWLLVLLLSRSGLDWDGLDIHRLLVLLLRWSVLYRDWLVSERLGRERGLREGLRPHIRFGRRW